jgi:hypothetical protein
MNDISRDEIATLRAENERLREGLQKLEALGHSFLLAWNQHREALAKCNQMFELWKPVRDQLLSYESNSARSFDIAESAVKQVLAAADKQGEDKP